MCDQVVENQVEVVELSAEELELVNGGGEGGFIFGAGPGGAFGAGVKSK